MSSKYIKVLQIIFLKNKNKTYYLFLLFQLTNKINQNFPITEKKQTQKKTLTKQKEIKQIPITIKNLQTNTNDNTSRLNSPSNLNISEKCKIKNLKFFQLK